VALFLGVLRGFGRLRHFLGLVENANLGRRKGREKISENRKIDLEQIKGRAVEVINAMNLSQDAAKIFCALLFWAEGNKSLNSVGFTNSDPGMISTFLSLLRKGFSIDERKIRVLVHLHEYHSKDEIERFWSDTTRIPLTQFSNPYLKKNSAINIKSGYKGCLSLRYYDAKIAKELYWLYTTLQQKLI